MNMANRVNMGGTRSLILNQDSGSAIHLINPIYLIHQKTL